LFSLCTSKSSKTHSNELLMRIELTTSSLPRKCSTAELQQLGCEGKKRAEDRARTGYPQLGRLTLYQMSYFRFFKISKKNKKRTLFLNMHSTRTQAPRPHQKRCGERRIRTFELREDRFTVCCRWPLGYLPKICHLVWSRRRDSNPRPADYKSAALPAELLRLDFQYVMNDFSPVSATFSEKGLQM
jgi:hypothetical protein